MGHCRMINSKTHVRFVRQSGAFVLEVIRKECPIIVPVLSISIVVIVGSHTLYSSNYSHLGLTYSVLLTC